MRQRDLISFFAMTFLIAWGILALYIFASETMARLFERLTGQHPLFYLAVYAPAIAALTLTLFRQGIDGTRCFLSRLLLWLPLLLLVPVAWFVLTARSVEIVVEPAPDLLKRYQRNPYGNYYLTGQPRFPVEPVPPDNEWKLMQPIVLVETTWKPSWKT